MDEYHRFLAREDFNRAKKRATLSSIFNAFAPSRERLLSLDDVRGIIKPKSEAYRGLKVVPISKIVGSEGRYNDFNKAFLPKRELLRQRWERVDVAHQQMINLPPIRLFEIGGVYFVRDGNHRVSVARSMGSEHIDAEVTSLSTDIVLHRDMSIPDMKRAVIQFECDQVFSQTDLSKILDPKELQFTATGRYGELLKHIEVHKYFINQDRAEEISFEDAACSWYSNLYRPVIDYIHKKRVMVRFPGRTDSDLYMWMMNHWHFMKNENGQSYPLEHALAEYSDRFGVRWFRRLKMRFSGRIN